MTKFRFTWFSVAAREELQFPAPAAPFPVPPVPPNSAWPRPPYCCYHAEPKSVCSQRDFSASRVCSWRLWSAPFSYKHTASRRESRAYWQSSGNWQACTRKKRRRHPEEDIRIKQTPAGIGPPVCRAHYENPDDLRISLVYPPTAHFPPCLQLASNAALRIFEQTFEGQSSKPSES